MPKDDAPVRMMGVSVPESEYLTEQRIKRIRALRYESDEITGALTVVRPGDRVIDMGAGLGIVSAVTATKTRPEAVLAFEGNPALLPHAQALMDKNGLSDRVELRNAVVVSDPEAAPEMTFHVRNSFLGSSLIQQTQRQSHAVQVQAQQWETIRGAFRPTVLLMDIEGGELAFLRHADLTGIRAIVVEFHPGIYGKDGARECKDILRAAGFRRDDDVSTRLVWTCTRPESAVHASPAPPETAPPDPESGPAHSLQRLHRALILPPATPGLSTPSGVLDQDGHMLPEAIHWRGARALNLPVAPQSGPVETLPGTWLYAGMFWRNFAHFIAESLGRLWGLDTIDRSEISGLVYMRSRAGGEEDLAPYQAQIFAAMGLENLPVRVLTAPARAQHLIVPGQGFGLGAIAAGTPSLRAFIHRHFGADIPADGPEKLYISRSALGEGRGGLVGEAHMEQQLAAEGYEIFHPEKHDIQTQLARFKAARHIIACEGSALHLAAMVLRADQKVAMIARRKSGVTRNIVDHLTHFSGTAPVIVEALRAEWIRRDSQRKRLALGEPDLRGIRRALSKAGFIKGRDHWPDLSETGCLDDLSARYERVTS